MDWNHRRLRVCASATVLALLASLTPQQPALAEAVAPVRTTALPTRAQAEQHHTLTLITGDRVDYVKDAAGRVRTTLIPSRTSGTTEYRSFSEPNGYYVIPMSAMRYVVSGALDRELFNVRYLAENGYGDDASASLPVIMRYSTEVAIGAVRERADKLPGTTAAHTLESLRAEGVSVAKKSAAQFWSTLAPPGAGGGTVASLGSNRLAGQVDKVMLDRKVSASLSDSVPLIGAPEAWRSGYDGSGVKVAVLDTGYDPDHPDLASRVTGSRNFTTDASATDGHGHGTHVAATIAGSGAASGGTRKGVAPGTQLLIGKVLNTAGSGYDSWIIDGMEWATAQGARVVSMSLGAGPTDGTDPMAQAVDQLSADTGTLFVIAAGNSGPDAGTVGSPGSASSALTVGATSKTDTLAGFSSRGPRLGDHAVKPEITAPGVNIIAARAAGTTMGRPVDDRYTTASGTSMATPHVAGAAAILAQRHPDWTGAQLKAALIGSSKDNGYTVWEQGAGRLDVGRAVQQTILATPAVLSAGVFTDPYTGQSATHDITFSNSSDTAVTLSLAASLKSPTGEAAPAGMLALNTGTVTVPAGGTATATVTIEPTLGPVGAYSGRVVATDPSGHTVTVPVGFVKGPRTHKLTVRLEMPKGIVESEASFGLPRVDDTSDGPAYYRADAWHRVDDPDAEVIESSSYLPEGVYSVSGWFTWQTELGKRGFGIEAARPEVDLTKDAVVTFRHSDPLAPVDLRLPSGALNRTYNYAMIRTTQSGAEYQSALGGLQRMSKVYYTPTEKPTIGKFKLTHDHIAGAAQAKLRLNGKGSAEVQPLYPHLNLLPKFPAGLTKLEVASEADLKEGRDVRGKLVAVEIDPNWSVTPELELAVNAGAAGVLAISDQHPTDLVWPRWDYLAKIPVLWLWRDGEDAAKARAVLSGAVRPSAQISSQPVTPYEYKLRYYELDRIPNQMVYTVDPKTLTRIDTDYHGQFTGQPGLPNAGESNHTFRPEDSWSQAVVNEFTAPTSRVEYYNQTGPDVMWVRNSSYWADGDRSGPGAIRYETSRRGFVQQTQETERHNTTPLVLGQGRLGPQFPQERPWGMPCVACRQGDRMYLVPRLLNAGDPTSESLNYAEYEVGLAVDGQSIPLQFGGVPYYDLPPGTGHYDYVLVYHDRFDGQKLAKNVRSEWSFTSSPPATNEVAQPYFCGGTLLSGDKRPCGWMPLIYPSLDLPLDLHDTTSAGRDFRFTVTAQQARPTDGPKIAGLTVSASFDDGKTWVTATVRDDGDGVFDVSVLHPALADTTGAVSLKLEAWDVDGNRVVQTIDRAYGLR
ncbi:S8 family serine peptidase [Micromonospora sp. NPDC050495]|uniref:S8 family peptidase n=1 Tax=Micromonospora sp. NPDC050495 TaxID=3154936 RepID=UPI0033E78458